MTRLRRYQQEAIDKVYDRLRRNESGAPCVVLPKGSGGTLVLATMCRDVARWGGRAIVLARAKSREERLQQAFTRVSAEVDGVSAGLYSAGLDERTADAQIIIAEIQSVCQRAEELGPFQLIVVDEAHLIPDSGDGIYRAFLDGARRVNPNVRLVGLTATPRRLDGGAVCGPERVLTEIVCEVGVRDLIEQGVLAPLKARAGRRRPDFSNVAIRGGEFVASEVEKAVKDKNVLDAACMEIAALTRDRRKVLVFASSVDAAKRIEKTLATQSRARAATVTGETRADERAAILDDFKRSEPVADLLGRETPPLKYLVDATVLTTGFDAPDVDCVVLLRPTNSVALYQQMVGCGLRLAPGKTDCLVLDYGQNVVRLGPIDTPRVGALGAPLARECPKCSALVADGYAACSECGHLFSVRRGADGLDESILEYDVGAVFYSEHEKRSASPDAPRTLQIDYEIAPGEYVREWLCPEHGGFLRRRFEERWRELSTVAPPETAEDAARLASLGALATPLRIRATRQPGENFPAIEWLVKTKIPEFDGDSHSGSGFEKFDRFDEPDVDAPPLDAEDYERQRAPTIYGVCADCLNHTSGYCAEFDRDVDENSPSCDRYVVNDDVPF